MSLRNELAAVLARDPRYTFQAYAFVLEALEYSKSLKLRKSQRTRDGNKSAPRSQHVSGGELCEAFRRLALDHYGLMALAVLRLWGIQFELPTSEKLFIISSRRATWKKRQVIRALTLMACSTLRRSFGEISS